MIMPPSAMTRIPRAIPITIAAYAKIGETLNELLSDRLLVKTAQDTGKQAHAKEHGGNLIHVPALGNKTPDDNAHTAGKIDKYELLTGSELFLDGGIGHGKTQHA